jgi:hypothetical protein
MDVALLEFGDGHTARVARSRQPAGVAAAVAGLGLRCQSDLGERSHSSGY